jgi:hypothetical protein
MSRRGGCYVIDAEIENLLETDPIAAHERIMEMTRPTLPTIVHKEYTGRQPALDNGNGNEPPPFTDEQVDIVAQALADVRVELRDEFASMIEEATGSLTEQVAVLQGQVSVLLSLIGTLVSNGNGNGNNNGNGTKSIEADEVRTTRRVRVRRTSESTT